MPDHTALLIVAAVGGVISNAAAIRSIGVTATAGPYEPYDPTPSVNLARTHLLVASPTGIIAGLDDPENTLPYPVDGAVTLADSTSSISIVLKVESVGVVYEMLYPLLIAVATIIAAGKVLTYDEAEKGTSALSLPYILTTLIDPLIVV